MAAAIFKEPVTHFVLLALVVFAVDHIALSRQDNPREIVVDGATYDELLNIFKEGKGRLPTEAEMGQVLLKWSENEVLYREAQRLELDRGDEMIRSRLILKIRNILFSNVVMPEVDEQDLRDFLSDNRARYDRPALFDLEQVRLADGAGQTSAVALAETANQASLDAATMQRVRRYAGRPAAALETVFDADDARQLLNADIGVWQPVRSPAGWHIARITDMRPGVEAQFENIRGKLAQDYESEAQQRELAQALQAIVKDYDIRLDLDAERVRESLTGPAVASRSDAR